MVKGQSFIGLTAYLEKCGKDEIKLSFISISRTGRILNHIQLHPGG